MTRRIIFIIFGLLQFACSEKETFDDTIIFGSKSDTLQIIKKYPSGSTREIVLYEDNKPYKNIGFRENGDTIKYPQIIFVNDNKSIFAFFPMRIADSTTLRQVLLGADSLRTEKLYFKKITEQIKSKTLDIKRSLIFDLTYDLEGDSAFDLVGVFKCRGLDSIYEYYPFKTRIK